MKNQLKIAAVLSVLAAPALADPAFGVWKSGEDGGLYGHIELYDCEGKICGKVLGQYDAETNASADNENTGKRILWGFEPQGDGTYENGRTWRATNDRIYRSRMRLKSDGTLKVSGCIGPVCLGQDWVRLN